MDLVWFKHFPLILLIVVWSAPGFTLAQSTGEKISPELQAEMDAAPQDFHPALLMLSSQVDVPALELDFRRRNASLETRSYELITALQAKAEETQPELLSKLNNMPGVTNIQPYWIMNAIFLDATAEALLELSRHPVVGWLDVDAPIRIENEAATFSPAPLSLDNVENGLQAIGAPEMWAMGYTGYGRKALIVDTGQDFEHPALHNQFAYHHQPLNQSWRGADGPLDCDIHGTHVTGIVLGLDRIAQDTIGVAFGGQWMGGIALSGDCAAGISTAGITNMLQWALNPDGNPATIDDRPDVINNSWASGSANCGSFDLRQLYDALYAAGIAVVFSAGNDGPAPETITAPKMSNWDLVRLFAVGNLNANSPSLPIANSSSRGPSICGGTGSLLIKPEVSAPGSSVRSSVAGGGYGNLSGTSMAAPHVSGAILLLKEAFPYLPGEELMLALYFTCTDLGAVGEDNNYGMGIINVPAAYQYLIDQGHEPVSPVSAPNDIALLRATTPRFNCAEEVAPLVLVENNGSDSIQSLTIQMSIEGASNLMLEYFWEGLLLPKQRMEIQLPALSVPAGEFVLLIDITQANGQADARGLDNTLKQKILVVADQIVPAEVSATVPACENGQALVQSLYEGIGKVRWFDASEGGMLLGEGPSILVDIAETPRTVYAEISPIRQLGRVTNEGGAAQWASTPEGLSFDVYSPCRLQSVKVYAEEAGGRLITLILPSGSSVNKVVQVQAGEQRVDLNFNLEPGEGYRLELKGGKALQFNLGGNSYPYDIPNVLSIRRSTAGLLQYYYFYDWTVEYDYFCGRTPVEIEVAASEIAVQAAFEPLDTTIDLALGGNELAFTDQSEGAISWLWNFGDGSTSTEQNPIHAYSDTGLYQVTLTVIGAEGCSNSTGGSVQVSESLISSISTPSGSWEMSIFPNPAQENIFISLALDQPTTVRLTLYDLVGRPARAHNIEWAGPDALEFSLVGLPAGAYVLVAETEQGRLARRLIKH